MIIRNTFLRIALFVITLSALIAVMALPVLAVYPTEPVATYDPCYDGHTYVDGFCTYCGAYDLNLLPPTAEQPSAPQHALKPVQPNVSESSQSTGFSFFGILVLIGAFLLGLIPVVLVILLIIVVVVLIVMLIKKKKN